MTATATQGASQTATGASRLGTHAGVASTPISRQGSRLGGVRRSISTTQLVAGSPFGHGASSSNGMSRQGSAVEQMGVLQPGLSVAAISRQCNCGPRPSIPDDGSDDAPHASAFPQRASPTGRLRLGIRRVASAASLLSPSGVMAAATLAAAAEELGVTTLSSSLTGRTFSQGSRLQRNNTSASVAAAASGDCATTMATTSSESSLHGRSALTAGDTQCGPADGSSRHGEECHDGMAGSQAGDTSLAADEEGMGSWSMDQLLASSSGAAGPCHGKGVSRLGEAPVLTSADCQTTECVPWATGGIPEQLLELELMLPDPCMGGESAKRSQTCPAAAFSSITRPPRRTNSRLAVNAGAADPLLDQMQHSLPSRAESRRRLTLLDAEGGSASQSQICQPAAEGASSPTGTASKGGSQGGLVRGLSGVRRQLSLAALGSSGSQRMFSTAGASSSGKGLGDSSGGILSRSGSSSGLLGSGTSSLRRRLAPAAPAVAAGAGAQGADEPSHASNTLPVQTSGAYSPSVPASQAAAASQVLPSRTTTISSSGSSRSSTCNSSTGGSESEVGTVLPVSTTYPNTSADSLVPGDGAAGGEYNTHRYGSWRPRLPEPPGPLDVDAAAPALEGRQLRQPTSGDITYILGRWGSRSRKDATEST